MNAPQKPVVEDMEKLKEIPRWSRRYAQNRTLTSLVLMVMIVLFGMFLAAFIVLSLYIIMTGFRKGNMLGCIGIVALIAVFLALANFYFNFWKKFGGKNKGLLDQIIDRWIYGREGTVSMPPPNLSKKKKWLDILFGMVYLVLFVGTMNLCMREYISVKYFLPFMAWFVIPYGIYLFVVQRPRLGPALLIFPILYTIHVILILVGVPLYFTGTYAIPLNILFIIIYQFLAYIIGHLYSRYALKKLKDITSSQGGEEG